MSETWMTSIEASVSWISGHLCGDAIQCSDHSEEYTRNIMHVSIIVLELPAKLQRVIGQFQVTVFSRFCYILLYNHEYIYCLNHRQAKDYITRRNETERKTLIWKKALIKCIEWGILREWPLLFAITHQWSGYSILIRCYHKIWIGDILTKTIQNDAVFEPVND